MSERHLVSAFHAKPRARFEVLQWVYWQMGGLGPMAGQNHHFRLFAPEKIDYAIDRYVKETARLYGVMDKQLAQHEYLAGDYSIADMACFPWIVPYERQAQKLTDFPNLKRWFDAMRARPAVRKAYERSADVNSNQMVLDTIALVLSPAT